MYHGTRTKKRVKEQPHAGDPFNRRSYSISKWLELVKKQIRKIISRGGIATLQIHPACMKIADEFNTFEKLCKWIDKGKYETICCKEVLSHVKEEKDENN